MIVMMSPIRPAGQNAERERERSTYGIWYCIWSQFFMSQQLKQLPALSLRPPTTRQISAKTNILD